MQSHHQQTHRWESRRLLLPQHLFPYGHLQVCPLRDRQPPRGREQPAGAPVWVHGAWAAGRRWRQQRGETVSLAGEREARQDQSRVLDYGNVDMFFSAVDLLRYQILGRVNPGEVCRCDGWPTLGHPHGAALRNSDWWWDEKAEHPHFARWWIHLSLGYWQVIQVLDSRKLDHCWPLYLVLFLFSGQQVSVFFFFSFYSLFCSSLTLTGRWSWAESVSVFGGKFFHWCSGSHQAHSHQLCFVLTLLPFSDTSELTRSSGWKPTSFRESSAQEGRATGWTTGRSTVWWDLILLFLSDKCDSEPLIRFVSL